MDRIEGFGPKTAETAIVLDFPSQLDWNLKRILDSDAKRLLSSLFKASGLSWEKTYVTFAIKTMVPTRKVAPGDIANYSMQLRAELADRGVTKALCMGSFAHAILHCTEKVIDIMRVRGKTSIVKLSDFHEVTTISTIPTYYLNDSEDMFRDLAYDIQKLGHVTHVFPLPKLDVTICETIEEVKNALLRLEGRDVICDLETSGFDPINDKIWAFGLGYSYGIGIDSGKICGQCYIIPKEMIYVDEVRDLLRPFFLNNHTIFHNAIFDLKFLTVYFGVSLLDIRISDTILMNYVLDERPIGGENGRGLSPHGLKTISRVRYDAEDYKFDFDKFAKLPEEQRNFMDLYKYLCLDLIYTAELYRDLTKEIEEESLRLFDVLENLLYPGTKSLVEIELRGALVDIPYLQNLRVELKKYLDDLLKLLREAILAKLVETKGHLTIEEEAFAHKFNVNSPKQVVYAIFDIFKMKGRRSGDKESLKDLIRSYGKESVEGRFLQGIISYREQSKVLSTYVDGALKLADSQGFIHPDYHANGTSTGRLSCSNPNFQNIPVLLGPKVLRAYIAPEGYTFVNADYSQLELRVAAYYSNDEKMKQVYIDRRDLHREVASAMYHKPTEEISKDERYAAKYVDFGVLYGRTAAAVATGPELADYHYSIEDAQELIDNFLDGFPQLKSWMQQQKKLAWSQYFTETPVGRRRRFPYLTQKNREEIGRKAVNTPIQSLASDFTFFALVRLHRRLAEYDSRVMGTVHDSIMFYVKTEHLDKCCKIIREEMIDVPVECSIPIDVDIKTGQSWAECK